MTRIGFRSSISVAAATVRCACAVAAGAFLFLGCRDSAPDGTRSAAAEAPAPKPPEKPRPEAFAPEAGGRFKWVQKDPAQGHAVGDVRLQIDPQTGEAQYAGLTFTTAAVLNVLEDGTLLADREGIVARDARGGRWTTRKVVAGADAFVFLPPPEPPKSVKELLAKVRDVEKLEGIESRTDAFLVVSMRNFQVSVAVKKIPSAERPGALSALVDLIETTRRSTRNRDLLICGNALYALGEFGPDAQEAVPLLQQLQKHKSQRVAGGAKDAINAIRKAAPRAAAAR